MNLEIERKFLLKDFPRFPGNLITTGSVIHQTYLASKDEKITARVRERIYGDRTEYSHTVKKRIADGIHEETEELITAAKYKELMLQRDPEKVTIYKLRTVFIWQNQTFEIDCFEHPKRICNLVVLEIELASMTTPIEFPPFIEIDREVTHDRKYTNAALARIRNDH